MLGKTKGTGTRPIIGVDTDGDPYICMDRKYMSSKYLSPRQRCEGCEWEISDLFHGTAGKSFFGWYCNFEKPERC